MELSTLTGEQITTLVESVPTKKRPAFTKALKAAAQYAKDRKNYQQAVDLAIAVLENEWRLGGELPKILQHGGHNKKQPNKSQVACTCSELGISWQRAAVSQQIARGFTLPQLRQWAKDQVNGSRDDITQPPSRLPSVSAAAKIAKQRESQEATDLDEYELPESANCVTSLDALEGQEFGTIYADPPWQYENQGTRASTDNHYSTMCVDDLMAMPINKLVADDAHLHLWTTNAFLFDAKFVMQSWGFEYKSCFVWVKPEMGIGNYWRVSHEFMLLGVRGKAKSFAERNHKSWLELPRTKHSAKPEDVRHLIEKVSPGPFLELFGRKPVTGWTVFGNQIESRLFA